MECSMGEFKMKKITKSTTYQLLSTVVFGIAIFAIVHQKIALGYVLIFIGYCLLRKSDFEK